MPRPRMRRRVQFSPRVTYFKPQGVPLRFLASEELTAEEMEAVRLKYVQDLDQKACAKQMNTSQSTLARILDSANKKIGRALAEGKAIKINNN